ncbi:MAG: hypothetical protein WAM91_07865, partial [Candidatus Acidiferrales bacterium]
MIRRAICSVAFAVLMGIGLVAGAQAQTTTPTDGYVDDFVVHLKSNCDLQMQTLVKKLVAASRANGGDNWLTIESVYGPGDVFRFASIRESYASIEQAQGKMMAALTKAMGEAGVNKFFADLDACAESTQGILRRRRWDLSTGVPADAAAQARVIGNARWERLIEVHVRPGMSLQYEDMLKRVKAAAEKSDPTVMSWVSVSVAGDQGTVYYIAQLRPTLGSFDGGKSMRELMGDSAYTDYQRDVAQVVTRTDVAIYQFSGELSNAPDDVAAVAP